MTLSLAAALAAGCAAHALPGEATLTPSCRITPPAADSAAPTRWQLPADPRDVDRLDRWCAAVGAVAFEAAPPPVRAAPADSLAVISWNAHVGGGDLDRLVGDLRAGRLTRGVPVEHFVLLLQEVHRADAAIPAIVAGAEIPRRVEAVPSSGERRDVTAVARDLGLALLYVPSMRNGAGAPSGLAEDRGNAILSTLPLTEPRAVELPFEAQRRVAVGAVVNGHSGGRDWSLLLASVHFDTRSAGGRALATLGAGRRRQAAGLVDALSDAPGAVVAGDLNTWSLPALEGALPLLRSHFPQTPAGPDAPTFSTPWGYARRLDHMFFRLPFGWEARYERVLDRYGSDHHPLLAWLVPAGAGARDPVVGTAPRGVSERGSS